MLPYEHRLQQLARHGFSAAKIAAELKREGHDISTSTVGRRLSALVGPQRASRSGATSRVTWARAPRPVATQAASRAEWRAELVAARTAADTDVAVAAAELALLRYDSQPLANELASGSSLVSALVSSGHGALLVLRRPEDIAELVWYLVEDPCSYEREPGQSSKAFAADLRAAGEAELARAVKLLEDALAIARSRALDPRWAVRP